MALTDYSYLDADDASGREFPNHILPNKIQVTIDQPTLVSTTNALTSQRRNLGAHRIELDYTYPPMDAEDLQPFVAFFSAMQGQGKSFKLNCEAKYLCISGDKLCLIGLPITENFSLAIALLL